MAARTATKTGVWSDVSVWDGGATLPQPGDTADSNGFTVTIDQDVTVTTLINTHASAGIFTITSTRTITANITATTRDVLQVNANSPVVVTVIGNVTGGSTTNADGIVKVGTSTLNITGNLVGGSAASAPALNNSGTGPINIIGNVTGSASNSSAFGLGSVAAATITITGNVAGASAPGVSNTSTGTVTVSGSATGGTVTNNSYGLANTGGGTATVGLAVGNNYGPGGGSIFAAGVNGGNTVGTVTRVYAVEYGPNGMAPTAGAVVLVKDAANTADFLASDATRRTLVVGGGGAVSIGPIRGGVGG